MTPELRKLSEEAPQGEAMLTDDGQIWLPDHPVATLVIGEWGDAATDVTTGEHSLAHVWGDVPRERAMAWGRLAVAAVNHVRARLAEPEADRAALEAENARLAEELALTHRRYQYLANATLDCDYGDNRTKRVGWCLRFTHREPILFGDSIDAAIDAAIAERDRAAFVRNLGRTE